MLERQLSLECWFPLKNPIHGTIELGETVKLAYVDQSRDELDGEKTVWQEISDGQDNLVIGNYEIASRAYASRFNFRGGDQQKFVKDLSGGERSFKFLLVPSKVKSASVCIWSDFIITDYKIIHLKLPNNFFTI